MQTMRKSETGIIVSKAAKLTARENFPKSFDVYSLLVKACAKEVLHLQVPDTLVHDSSSLHFLYTDSAGVLRLLSGQKLKLMKNLNPLGHRFPKYASFVGSAVQHTLMRSADAKLFTQTPFERVQRYVMPEHFIVQKKAVRWRRTKVTKVYSVVSRLPLKAKKANEAGGAAGTGKETLGSTMASEREEPGLSFDPAYVASLHNYKPCDVTKEQRVGEDVERMAQVLKHLIETYLLGSLEILEDFVFSLLRSQDGLSYFLSASRYRTSSLNPQSPDFSRSKQHHKNMSIVELTSRIADRETMNHIQKMPLPDLNMKDISETFNAMYLQLVPSPEQLPPPTHTRCQSDVLISEHIDAVACNFDRLREQSQVLKKAHNVKQTVKFTNYDAGFLGRIIKKMYDSILRDSKLSKYYADKEKVQSQIALAVRHVIHNGTSKMNMRKIHYHLHITDSDFDLYIHYFTSALQSERAQPEDVEAAQLFLEDYRGDVVTRRIDESS